MNDSENGYAIVDTDSGTIHIVTYNSIGNGLVMIIFLVIATIFIKSANAFLMNNKWIIIIPTIIEVLIRTLLFDKNISLNKRIIHIIGDITKTICMYCVLLATIDQIANSHWLDRVFLALLYSALFFGANWLINFALKRLRIFQMDIVHLIVCLAISAGALCLYFNHAWYWQGYEYTVFLNKAAIVKVDERKEGEIEIPSKIYNYTVESIDKGAFAYNKRVTHIKIPNTVKVIKEDVFGLATNLQAVFIPKSVKKIENQLFSFSYNFEIFYEGSEEDWNRINIQDSDIKNLTIHFNYN